MVVWQVKAAMRALREEAAAVAEGDQEEGEVSRGRHPSTD